MMSHPAFLESPTMPSKPRARRSAWRPIDIDTFLVGAAHYPEHVDEAVWERDAARIAEAGFNVVRMGEFAWNLFEPQPGQYEFDLFDRAVALLGRHGVKTILCTPTATPPRWLTAAHPEILRVDARGVPHRHGSRQHVDTVHPLFREHSRRITRVMAEHYRDDPNVIGWQTDNELNTSCSETYSDAAEAAFRSFLEQRYATIEALNQAWGTRFWAQTYDDFGQVELPRPFTPVASNPTHRLDYHRFLAEATAAFQRDQVEILRAVNPGWFVYHNIGAINDIDMRGPFSEDLDFLGYDVYPFLFDELLRHGHAHCQALALDWVRGAAGNLIVPEQQSSFGSQPGFATVAPEPGEMRRMAFSSVARGVDGVLFFRWRPAHFGAEIYWMGVIDHDDVPRGRFEEAKRFAGEIGRIAPEVLGSSVHLDVGIAGPDFVNEEAHKAYALGLPTPQQAAVPVHGHCYTRGIACGFVHPEDELNRLKVFIVPHWAVWDPAWTGPLERFVRNGGTAIIGARSGAHTLDNHALRVAPPGELAALTGVTVEGFGPLATPGGNGVSAQFEMSRGVVVPPDRPAESARRRYELTIGNTALQAGHWFERLSLRDGTEAIGRWTSRFLAGEPAITSRRHGRGRVIYAGTYFTPELTDALLGRVLPEAGVAPLVPGLPEGVEVSLRRAGDRELLFLQNTRAEPVTIASVPAGRDLLSGAATGRDRFELGGYGCAVLRLAPTPR